jgi:hypothetical protein
MLLKSLTIAAALLVAAAASVQFPNAAQAQAAAGGGQGGKGGSGGAGPTGGSGGDGATAVDVIARVPSSRSIAYNPSRQVNRYPYYVQPKPNNLCANGMTPLGYMDCVPR